MRAVHATVKVYGDGEGNMAALKGGPVVALIGCGRWGHHILRDLQLLGCEVPVVTRSPESRVLAKRCGASSVASRVIDLPASVDAVVVATPTSTHASVLDEVLALGLPVYTEKPMTCDPESAARLARDASGQLFVMDKWRYHPGVGALSEIARSGELGKVRGLRTTRVQWGGPHEDVDPIWILLPHDLSIALHILGAIPSPRAAMLEGPVDAPLGLIGLLDGEAECVIEVSAGRSEQRRHIELLCEHGVASLGDSDYTAVRIARTGADRETETRLVSDELPLLRELRAFVDHVRGGPPPLSNAIDGAAIVEAVASLRVLAGLDQGSTR